MGTKNIFKPLFDKLKDSFRTRNEYAEAFLSNFDPEEGFARLWARLERGGIASRGVSQHEDPEISIKLSEVKRLMKVAYMQRGTDARKHYDLLSQQVDESLGRAEYNARYDAEDDTL